MRILLTGASGLIGSTMARALSHHHEIVTLGRRDSSDVRVDLFDYAALAAADLGQVDALVHCAGVTDEDVREDRERALRSAVLGADALVLAAMAAGARRLVYVSSAHVYGPMVGVIDESCAPNPLSDYAIAHFATEQVFHRHAVAGAVGLALRPCAVFGDLPDLDGFRRWSLIPFSFPREALVEHTISLSSTGEQRRNFVGTEDIALVCRTWLGRDAAPWTVLNPLGALDGTVFEFAQLCAELSLEVSGTPCAVSRRPVESASMPDTYRYASTSRTSRGAQSVSDTIKRLMVTLQTRG